MTDLQQKILFYISEGYEAKEIAGQIDKSRRFVEKELWLLRIEFKANNTTRLVDILYDKGIMQQIKKEYLNFLK